MPQNMETSVGEGLSLSASSAHHSGPNVYVCGTETNYCRASSIESGDGVFFFLRAPQAPAAATAITPRSLSAPPVSAVVATSFYNLLARIFREVGCSRIASLWWDQGTGVDPTRNRNANPDPDPDPNPDPNPDQNGPKTSQTRGYAAFASNEKIRQQF